MIVHGWKVTRRGMDRDGYWIKASRYNEIANYVGPWCSDWLAHVATTKEAWNLEEFIAAFAEAMKLANITPAFDWERSVAYARAERRANEEYRQVRRELFPRPEKFPLPWADLDIQDAAVRAEIARQRRTPWEPTGEEAQQLYREAAIQLEVITILDGAGLGPSADPHEAAVALGLTLQQVLDRAHQRVLDRTAWPPEDAAP